MRILAALAFTAALVSSAVARAEPQANAGLTIGAAGVGVDRAYWQNTVFHLGLKGDVLFGRDRASDLGFGPYAEVATHAFDEIQTGAGLSLLLPVIEYMPVVVSGGTYLRYGDDPYGLEPGLAAHLFWGTRSYNFHANYVMAAGLLTELRHNLGGSGGTSIVVGAQLDLAAMSLPFLFLINAIRGGSRDVAPPSR